MNAAALQIGIVVKGGGNLEPVVRKLAIAQQRLPQMTRAHQHGHIGVIIAQKMLDVLDQPMHAEAHARLAGLAADGGQILAHLHLVNAQRIGNGGGRHIGVLLASSSLRYLR